MTNTGRSRTDCNGLSLNSPPSYERSSSSASSIPAVRLAVSASAWLSAGAEIKGLRVIGCVIRSPDLPGPTKGRDEGRVCNLQHLGVTHFRGWSYFVGMGVMEYSSLVRTNDSRNDDMTSI